MPYRLDFDSEQLLFLGYSWGRLTEQEMLAAFEHAAATAPQHLESDELILTHANMDSSAIDMPVLQRLRDAEMRLFGNKDAGNARPARSAIYCSNAMVNPMLRLYGALLDHEEGYGVELRVFDQLPAALAWLGRDDPSFEARLRRQAEEIMGGLG